MRRSHFEAFGPICPVCVRAGRGDNALVLPVICAEDDKGVKAGILHCSAAACQHEYPIIDGLPIIVPDVRRLLSERGVELFLRNDLDPRLESLVGDAIGPDSWFDAPRQMLSTYGFDAYADLDPAEQIFAESPGPVPGAALRCLARLLEFLGSADEPPARMLDLGCAAGRTSFHLAEAFPNALVLGLDLNLALLGLARGALYGEVSYPRRRTGIAYDRRRFPVAFPAAANVDFWACDALALPMRPGSADLAVALNLIDCVPDPRALLTEFLRVLGPTGAALLATPYDWSSRVTPLENWLGGHSQRAAHAGAPEAFLHSLLEAVTGVSIRGELSAWPWQTRLHDRSSVSYRTHLMALQKS